MFCAFLAILALYCVLSVSVLCVTGSAALDAPTSQPSAAYIAPTVPEEYIGGGLSNAAMNIPTSQPSEASERFVAPTVPEDYIGGAFSLVPTLSPSPTKGVIETFEDEITEENNTALSASSYIFFAFVFLVLFFVLAYISKR